MRALKTRYSPLGTWPCALGLVIGHQDLYSAHVELSRSSNGYFNFKPLLGPGDGFTSETAALW
jgi:hypothetical protein